MSFYIDLTYTLLKGPSESVVKMLNAAICNVSGGDAIADGDSIDIMNEKLKAEDGYGLRLALPDLLHSEHLLDSRLVAKKEEFFKKDTDEDPDEDRLFNTRMIDIIRVREASATQLSVEFVLYESEYGYYSDWLYWDEIARVYGCKIIVVDELFKGRAFMEYSSAFVFEPKGDNVEKVYIKSPEADADPDVVLEQLVEIYPERYLPIRNSKIKAANDRQEREQLMAKLNITIHEELWKIFSSWEVEGVEALDNVFKANIKRAVQNPEWATADDFATVLRLRAEKWAGIDDELSACYTSLLESFPEAMEREMQNAEEENAPGTSGDDADLPF